MSARRSVLRWLAGVLAALTPVEVAALEPQSAFERYRHWAWPDVGHTSTVWGLAQARTGHLWIATREGLVRFDGRTMTSFDARRVPGLVAREVTSVVEGRGGVLWAGAREGGLFAIRMKGDRGEILARTPGVVIRQMAEGPDGTLWIAAHNGMARVEPGALSARFVNEGLPSIVATRVTIDAVGTPWAGTAKGAARWNGRRWEPVRGPDGAESPADAFAVEPDGTVWIGSRDAGLWRWRDGAWRVYRKADGLPTDSLIAILRDRSGRLWVATVEGGLAWLDGDRFRPLETPAALCAGKVLALLEDREEGLWLATSGCGLHRLRAPLFGHLADGLPEPRALAVAMVEGAPWVATAGGLARWDGRRFLPIACESGGCGECWALAPGRSSGAWISCIGKPARLWSGARWRAETAPDLAAPFVLDAVDGSRWIDTGREILREVGGVAAVVREAALLGDRRLLLQGRAGRVWVVGSEGALLWHRGAVKVFRGAGLEPSQPASPYEDGDGSLWIATRGSGLRRTHGDSIVQVDARHGLPTGWIAQVIEDDAGQLWMSSSRGLLRVAKTELDDVVAGRRAAVNVTLFDASEGVALTEKPFLGMPAAMRAADGRLWFATNTGILVVEPGALRVPAPPVVVDEIRVGDRPLAPERAARGELSGSQDVQIHFAAVTFEAPETVATRHRLEGWDAQWRDGTAAAVARYERLPPGEYRFRVRAVSRDGVSLGPEASLALILSPPLYRSPWFIAGVVAVAGASLFWAHRLRLARARAGMRAIMGERARIARDIHDTLAQAFVATSVQLECVDKALEDGDLPSAQRHLASAREVVTGSLDEARRSVWVLRPQALDEGLAPALRTLVERMSGAPAVTLDQIGPPRRLPAAIEAHLLRIAQEAVANAARHAHATRVHVRLELGAEAVSLSVQDDGVGYAPGGGDPNVPHQGVAGMRERAAEMGARLAIDATDRGTTLRVEVKA